MPERETTLSEDLFALMRSGSADTGRLEQVDRILERAKVEGINSQKTSVPNSPEGTVELSLVPKGYTKSTTIVRVHPADGFISAAVCGTENPHEIAHPPSLRILWGLSETSDVVVNECRFADFGKERVLLDVTVGYCTSGRDKGLFTGSTLTVRQTGPDRCDEEATSFKLDDPKILRSLLTGKVARFDRISKVEGMGRVEFAITKRPSESVLLKVTAHAEEERPVIMRRNPMPVRVTAESLMEIFRDKLMDLTLAGGL